MAAVQRRVSDPSSIKAGRGHNRSDVGDEGTEVGSINEDSMWSPEMEPAYPVLKTSEASRRPSDGFTLDRSVSFRSADVMRQKEGLCTAVSEEGLHGLFYNRQKVEGDDGAAERLVNFLYAKVLTDRGTAAVIKEPEIDKLRLHQYKFVDLVFGGDGQSLQAAGADLCAVHRKLLQGSGIDKETWDHYVKLFEQEVNALQDAAEDQRATAISAIHTTKQHFVAS